MSPEVWALADRAVRELAPQALDALLCGEEAARLRALDPIANPLAASEAVSAAFTMRGRQHPRAATWAIADAAAWVAYAAERGRADLVKRRAAVLERDVAPILARPSRAMEVSA